MSVKEIESAVAKLPRSELAVFANWFAAFQTEAWDQQIEADYHAGRLDALIQEAKDEIAAGKRTPL